MRSLSSALNRITSTYTLTARNKTVPVMALIAAHQPSNPVTLTGLIADHRFPGCPCGLRSKGTVQDFGEKLYEAQFKPKGQLILDGAPEGSLQDCVDWCFDLFVLKSLKGNDMEIRAVHLAIQHLPPWISVRRASEFQDFSFRIDILLHGRGKTSAIQVKPDSYRKIDRGIQAIDTAANHQFGNPVHYLYYDSDLEFYGADDVFARIANHHGGTGADPNDNASAGSGGYASAGSGGYASAGRK